MKLAGRIQSINFPGMIFVALLLLSACAPWRYQRMARLPEVLGEASGLYVAAQDTCWWINDSGGQPMLYATSLKGDLLDSLLVPAAQNVDWEELTTDDQGYFYLCDMGNNRNARQDLTLYKWKAGMAEAEQIRFRYPDQNAFPPDPERANFDAEGCFWYGDSLYIFSKNRSGAGNYFTKLYVLPDQPGNYVAHLRDSLYLGDRVVTGAAIRSDGQEVVLLTYDYRVGKGWPLKCSLFWLTDFEGDNFLQARLHRQEIPPLRLGWQFESIDYLNDDMLLIASEMSPLTAAFSVRLRRR